MCPGVIRQTPRPATWTAVRAGIVVGCLLGHAMSAHLKAQSNAPQGLPEPCVLESPVLRFEVDAETGRWSLLDKRSKVRWPTSGTASAGEFTPPLAGGFDGRKTRPTALC